MSFGPAVALDRFFHAQWYEWQHPDAAAGDPLAHFLDVGCGRLYDPSPLVDFAKLVDRWGMADDPAAAYRELCRHGASPAEGVYRDRAELAEAQRRFRAAIGPGVVTRMVPAGERRPNLLFVQNRRSPMLHRWLAETDRSFDIWVNYYDASTFEPWSADWVSAQVGTKFTAIASLYEAHRAAFDSYDYVWLLDDDIELDGGQIDAAFHAAAVANADLAQPSLSHDSHCMWPALYTRPRSRWREVTTVEIMMPMYARRLARLAFPEYWRSISGFGLDLLSGVLCAGVGGRAVVLDEVVARHSSVIDQAGGEYYTFLRRHDINASAELWCLAQELDLPLAIAEVSADASAGLGYVV